MKISPGQADSESQAYIEGMEAFAAEMVGDRTRRACPYASDDARAGSWEAGFDCQQQIAAALGVKRLVERL
ncbi:hypothetical protein [Arenimonas sp.]|uniref:hypothetical protein n=1 Tax=Arenimonas sp. TaxID=1872635 RepID=UPI0025C2227E|nr:hypothetical protein [Arenimonas sp.]